MSFEIDNQTLDDLNIFSDKKNDNSIFDIFKNTKTTGGQNSLIKMMRQPSNDLDILATRIEAIQYLQNNKVPYDFNERELDFIEHYLNQNVPPLRKGWFYALSDWITYSIQPNNEYYVIRKGVKYLKEFLIQLIKYIEYLQKSNCPEFFKKFISEANTILNRDFFQLFVFSDNKVKKLRFINYCDFTIRNFEKDKVLKLINLIYHIDALTTIANAGKANNFCLPSYKQTDSALINIENIYHPFVNKPVTNNIQFAQNTNMCFLTGANMAGKSTFLKSVGLCCYLSHIGFPVPASKMETSIFSGLITTINLSDDVSKGYSHFYSEVKRVKNTALKIKEKRKVLVIFDELFRGTNVKDAYDASLMITSAFSNITQCAFFISTHIIEIADELKNKGNIIFKYFESDIIGETPIYSYKLLNGVSEERHGLRIVKNEKIVEILNELPDEYKL